MQSLSRLETAFEGTAGIERLLFFRYKTDTGNYKEIPVVTERYWTGDGVSGAKSEYFSARALAGNNGRKDFRAQANSVSVTVCHTRRVVRFGPKGNIVMLQKGIGLGSALMSHVIERLLSTGCDDYAVESGTLSGADAVKPGNLVRRNKFYIRHGFELSSAMGSAGLAVVEGHFGAASVSQLTPSLRPDTSMCDWSTVQLHSFQEQMDGSNAKRALGQLQDWYRHRLGVLGRLVVNRLRIPIR